METDNMHTILYLPCFDYFHHRQRPQHLLWEISKLGFEVIYCNVSRRIPDIIKLSPSFSLCNNPGALDLKRKYIMWLTHGPYVDILPQFNLELVVSDFADASVDEFAEYAPYDKPKANAADIIVGASESIFDYLSKDYHHCHLIKNGVDPVHFQKSSIAGANIPEGIARIGLNRPIIGFWGALSPWLDLSLLSCIADFRQGYNFVLIGGCNLDSSLLPQRDNIHYLGSLDYEILPVYARYFDAAIIPFQIKPVTLAADPIKVYEYLASGLPTVSTDLPQLRGIADIKLSKNPQEFVKNLDWAVFHGKDHKSIQERLAYASLNSWKSRAGILKEILNDYIEYGGNH
jgi:glycosyltransferase involved in cell wall biosynthesis